MPCKMGYGMLIVDIVVSAVFGTAIVTILVNCWVLDKITKEKENEVN